MRHSLLVAVALALFSAGPALAVPVEEPLYQAPGSTGPVIGYNFAGMLGHSGLSILAMPTMLQVTAVAPGSPAAMADLPAPEHARVRLAAVDGRAVEAFSLPDLLARFSPACGSVKLTFAVKQDGAFAEVFRGPCELPLSAQAIAELRAHQRVDAERFGESDVDLADQDTATHDGERLLAAAQDAAAGGDYAHARKLIAPIRPRQPLFAEAQSLERRWRQAQLNAVLQDADQLASLGDYSAALASLRSVPDDEGWHKIRSDRETRWTSALAESAAYRKLKQAEADRQRAAERAAERERLARRRHHHG